MAARAIWKGIIKIGKLSLPVKLYSAVTDRSIHFRLLHKTDKQPVKQKLISSADGDELDAKEIRKALPVDRGRLVVIEPDELEELAPPESRDIEVTRFVDPDDIDHRWYERAYYLGPDGSGAAYFALAAALEKKKKEGVVRWTMRKRSYVGALRAEDGYLMLIALRKAEEVITAESLAAPEGRGLTKRERAMASQLLAGLEGPFVPEEFHDNYRERVLDLIETKSKGGRVKVAKFRPRATGDDSLERALEASLGGRKKAARG